MFKRKLFLYGLGTGLIIASIVLHLESFTHKAEGDEAASAQQQEIQWEAVFLEQFDAIAEAAQHHGYVLVVEDVYMDLDKQPSFDDIVLNEDEPAEEMSITIIEGMGSVEVAHLLEQSGLITDRDQFEQAMANRMLTRRIQIGTYHFEAMPQLDDLIDMITK